MVTVVAATVGSVVEYGELSGGDSCLTVVAGSSRSVDDVSPAMFGGKIVE